jgi:hypothetical protein
MTETIRRRPARLTPLLLILGVFALLASALLAPAAHAAPGAPAAAAVVDSARLPNKAGIAAASYDQVYPCTSDGSTESVWIGFCHGVWYNSNPNARSLEIDFDPVSYAYASAFRNTTLTKVATLDGTKKEFWVYCAYPNGSSSGLKLGPYIIGGGYATSRSFNWNGCQGYSDGVVITVYGWYGSSAHITTKVWANDSAEAGPYHHRGEQHTYPTTG